MNWGKLKRIKDSRLKAKRFIGFFLSSVKNDYWRLKFFLTNPITYTKLKKLIRKEGNLI